MNGPHREDVLALGAIAGCGAAGVIYGVVSGAGARLPVAPQLIGTATEYAAIVLRNGCVCAALVVSPHVTRGRRWATAVADAFAAVVAFPAAWLAGLIVTHRGGPSLMVHAPLELTAVALACSCNWRHGPRQSWRATVDRLAVVGALVLIAAAVEVFATPHASRPGMTGRNPADMTLATPNSPRCGLRRPVAGGLIERARASSTHCTRREQSAFQREQRGG